MDPSDCKCKHFVTCFIPFLLKSVDNSLCRQVKVAVEYWPGSVDSLGLAASEQRRNRFKGSPPRAMERRDVVHKEIGQSYAIRSTSTTASKRVSSNNNATTVSSTQGEIRQTNLPPMVSHGHDLPIPREVELTDLGTRLKMMGKIEEGMSPPPIKHTTTLACEIQMKDPFFLLGSHRQVFLCCICHRHGQVS